MNKRTGRLCRSNKSRQRQATISRKHRELHDRLFDSEVPSLRKLKRGLKFEFRLDILSRLSSWAPKGPGATCELSHTLHWTSNPTSPGPLAEWVLHFDKQLYFEASNK